MTKFLVEIEKVPGSTNMIYFEMEPKADCMELAKRLSVASPGCRVSLTAHARVRRAYLDGRVVMSNPRLDSFFINVSSQDQWDWSCWGQVLD